MRVGFGFDVHKLVEGRDLILGGIKVPYTKGLLGHSDADVLIHALIDAILGAAAKGDIGRLFPDNDPKYKDINSMILLKEAYKKVSLDGYSIVNIDSTIVAQEPKLASYIDEMRKSIAETLGIDIGQVSVKAKTTEGLGFTGTGDGMAAYVVVNIEFSNNGIVEF